MYTDLQYGRDITIPRISCIRCWPPQNRSGTDIGVGDFRLATALAYSDVMATRVASCIFCLQALFCWTYWYVFSYLAPVLFDFRSWNEYLTTVLHSSAQVRACYVYAGWDRDHYHRPRSLAYKYNKTHYLAKCKVCQKNWFFNAYINE
jgi:hypothetical protein